MYHFFQRETLGLGDEEPDESGAHEGEEAEDDVSPVGDAVKHVWRNLTDDEVVPRIISPKALVIEPM